MRRQQAESIGSIYRAILDNTWLGPAMQRIDVFNAWDTITGPQVSKATAGKFFKDGTLIVTLTSSALRSHLYFQLENIRGRMNVSLSGRMESPVKKITLR